MTAPLDSAGGLSVEALRRRVDPGALCDGSDRTHGTARRGANLFAVYSPKGAAGRSTLAANLAIMLHRRTRRETLLVDAAGEQGELDLHLNVAPRAGIAEVLHGSTLDAALTPHATGVQLLGSGGAEPDKLATMLRWLKQRNGWIVVDSAPGLTPANTVLLEQADRILIPLFLDVAHLRRLKRDLARIESAGLAERVILVAWQERTDVTVAAAHRILGVPIQAELPFDQPAARQAINRGIPLVESQPTGPLAREIGRLVDLLVEPEVRALVAIDGSGPLTRLLGWLGLGPAAQLGT